MTHPPRSQWPEPYRPKPVAPDRDGPTKRLAPYRSLFPLSKQYSFGLCLALIGPSAVAFLLFVLSPAVYRAQTNVIVTIGLEHQARSSDGTFETTLQKPSQELVNAEVDLLANPVVVERTLEHFGVAGLYPDFLTSQAGSQMAWDSAIGQFQSSLRVVPTSQSGVIRLTFEHANPSAAAKALTQFVLSYQASRAITLERRKSRIDAVTIAHNVKDLEHLERAREEMRTTIGTPDLAQQRELLIHQRADTDTHLRQTVERVQALSSRLAGLAQIRSRMSVENPSNEPDNHPRISAARNVTAERNPVRADTAPFKEQTVVVQDQSTRAGAATAKLSSAQLPIQLAPRLLTHFMTRDQGLPAKAVAGVALATYEALIARHLRDLDSLEQKHVETKPALKFAAAGRPPVARRTDMSEQPLQPESNAGSPGTQNTVLAQSPKSSNLGMLPTLTGAAPVTIAAPEVWADLGRRQIATPSGDDQGDSLVQWQQQRPSAIQELVGGARVIPAKLPIALRSVATAIDPDRVSAQAELDALKARQTIDVGSIGLIDQKLLGLEQADLRLNLLNARITDQHERVTAAQRLYDNAKAAEDADRAGIGDVLQTSSEAVSVSSMAPRASALAFGSAFTSLILAATVLMIARLSTRRSIARDGALELFLNPPRTETG